MTRGGARGRRGRRPRVWWLAVLVLAVAAAVASGRIGQRWVGTEAAEVFFVRYGGAGGSGTLVPVRHAVPRGDPEMRLSGALRDLFAGPSPEEQRRGLVSEIPAGTTLHGVQVRQGVVTVDLTSAFGRGGGSTSMLARVWQVVYTASQLRSAPEVQILLDGRRVETIGGEGIVIGMPLRRQTAPPAF